LQYDNAKLQLATVNRGQNMDNPTDERITVTVKGLSVTAWNEARMAATKTGEPMGVWLSRAIVEQANREAGRPREIEE
jgi:hypothetical protein